MSFSPLYKTPTGADRDLSTLSNYLDIRTTHIDLVWSIDWDKKVFGGHATLDLEASKDVREVVLDTSYLDVKGVEVDGAKAEWKLDDRIDVMGQALRVKLDKKRSKGEVSVERENIKMKRKVSELTADGQGQGRVLDYQGLHGCWVAREGPDKERQVPLPVFASPGCESSLVEVRGLTLDSRPLNASLPGYAGHQGDVRFPGDLRPSSPHVRPAPEPSSGRRARARQGD